MANLDPTWLVFGAFLLACGGIPAVMALRAEMGGRLPAARPQPLGRPAQWQWSASNGFGDGGKDVLSAPVPGCFMPR